MNPIIQAIQSHIDNGDRPTNFFSDFSDKPGAERPGGILVQLKNGKRVRHAIETVDHNQFFEWFKQADGWWKAITGTR